MADAVLGWGEGGQGHPEDSKQAWRTAEVFGSVTSADQQGRRETPPPTHQQQGLFLKCGGGKALKNALFHAKGL